MGFRKIVLIAGLGPAGGYLRDAVKDSVVRGEAPFVTHAVVLSASDMAGASNLRYVMACMSVWMQDAEAAVWYSDIGGEDPDVRLMLGYAQNLGLPIERRSLPEWQSVQVSGMGGDPDPAAWAT